MMDLWEQFHFLRPMWLLLLPVVWWLWWWTWRQHDPLSGWRKQVDPDLLDALVIGNHQPNRGWWLPWIGWTVAVVSVAGPVWQREPSPFAEDSPPLLVLLSAQSSMSQAPPAPSRMERAQLKLVDLAKSDPTRAIGLIAYAGSAHLVLPPTTDAQAVVTLATEISPEIMPVDGDRLDLALRQAEQLLEREGQGGSILIIADGISETTVQRLANQPMVDRFPVQILAIAGDGQFGTQQFREAARRFSGTLVIPTTDNQDVETINRFANRRGVQSAAGASTRWRESGYWLVLPVVFIYLTTFRRQNRRHRPSNRSGESL